VAPAIRDLDVERAQVFEGLRQSLGRAGERQLGGSAGDHGESVGHRVLEPDRGRLDAERAGLEEAQVVELRETVDRADGGRAHERRGGGLIQEVVPGHDRDRMGVVRAIAEFVQDIDPHHPDRRGACQAARRLRLDREARPLGRPHVDVIGDSDQGRAGQAVTGIRRDAEATRTPH
jgi:hypothetical protein